MKLLPLLALLLLSAPAWAAKRGPEPSSKAKAIARTARSYLPEEKDKAQRSPEDCSDFVRRVFKANGISLPRTSRDMSLIGRRVKSAKELRMGDLVFFSGENISRIVGHVGIYINNGIFIHLTRREVGVRMESLYTDYFRKRYLTARRVL